MAPALQPGDRLLVWRTRPARPGDIVPGDIVPGDIVVARDPRQDARVLVKRAGAVAPDGLSLLGDNPEESTDSRQFGRVPYSAVIGRAVYRYAPPARSGRLARGGH
jgi:nickel-type superoxide dismutase maturation protease